jgi:hypothetical protein
MNPAADVRSLDVLKDWHAALCQFRTEALDALAACDLEIRRAADWLADQRDHWRQMIREAEDEVTQAKAELAARRFPDFSGRMPDTSVQQKALRAAEAKRDFAEEMAERCRRWIQKLPHAVSESYEGPARQLSGLLEGELPRGLALLERRIDALDAYLNVQAPAAPKIEPPRTEDRGRSDGPAV